MVTTTDDQSFVDLATQRFGWDEQLALAFDYASNAGQLDKKRPRSIDVAQRVIGLGLDRDAVIATLLSDPGLRKQLDMVQIEAQFGETITRLTRGVNQLNTLKEGKQTRLDSPEQVERLRRLLMAIISDVRVMLIKLCYRVERLPLLKFDDYEQRRWIAQETLDIFAPLANRLGMGLLKWELEDLAFRALEPQAYKRIAKLLEEKRSEREAFIKRFCDRLDKMLREQEIKASVQGRVKHIVSIWRKMQRKNLEFHELFDVRAVRILVDSVADCYAVLGIVHTTWQHIPQEFDDYIANPKANGYQSLHTAVAVDEGKIVEVQIRTRQMHENSELGVASHWRYKEGCAWISAWNRTSRKCAICCRVRRKRCRMQSRKFRPKCPMTGYTCLPRLARLSIFRRAAHRSILPTAFIRKSVIAAVAPR